METFLGGNWFWLVLILFVVGLHAFSGGCGMGHHRRSKEDSSDKSKEGKACH